MSTTPHAEICRPTSRMARRIADSPKKWLLVSESTVDRTYRNKVNGRVVVVLTPAAYARAERRNARTA